MATINIQITAPINALSTYADELGYQSQVVSGGDENNPGTLIPNPQSKQEFLGEQVKNIVASALAAKKAEAVARTKAEEAKTERATLADQIKKVTTVTIS